MQLQFNKLKKKKYFLAKTPIEEKLFIKKNKFYLGYFCISKKSKLENFNSQTVITDHWKLNNNQLIKKKYYFEKISEKILIFLTEYLNKIHNKNKSIDYWRIIITPWIINYITVVYDRWSIISELKKKYKNFYFYTHEFRNEKKISEILNYNSWYLLTQSDQYNNYLFNKIIKYRKIKNVEIKLNNYKFKNPKTKKYNFKLYVLNFYKILVSKISFYFNSIYFDNIYMQKFDFLKLCFKLFQIPIKQTAIFDKILEDKPYNIDLRNRIILKKNYKSNFELFLYNEIKYSIPKSYLENYISYLEYLKNFSKKKRLIIGSTLMLFNDKFKIFLAESKLNRSKYFFYDHGYGFHPKNGLIFKHLVKICDKFITSQKLLKFKKKLNLHCNFFSEKIKQKGENKKILITYVEHEKYLVRFPIEIVPFCYQVENFKKLIGCLKNLKSEIKEVLKFRVKESNSLNSDLRFANTFGKKRLENAKLITYAKSLDESKLVICFFPQTSYIEPIAKNIPTILIGNKFGIFNHPDFNQILTKLKKFNMYFDDYSLAVKFINSNYSHISKWWNNHKLQKFRRFFLTKFYNNSSSTFNKLKTLLEAETKLLNQ